MKRLFLVVVVSMAGASFLYGQHITASEKQKKDIYTLIDKYSQARENQDTILLKNILTDDIDQLVSTGEWRNGIGASVKGMLRSSAGSPGTRTLSIDKIKHLTPGIAIVDCKYEIKNTDGTARKMWSTFVVVSDKDNGIWKISAIRNMLPAGSR